MSGYAFGKGVYFADMFQKSFNYCRMGDDYSYHHRPGKKQKQVRSLTSCVCVCVCVPCVSCGPTT